MFFSFKGSWKFEQILCCCCWVLFLFFCYLLTHSTEFRPSSVKPIWNQSLGLKRAAIPSDKHKPQQEYLWFIPDCLIYHQLHSHTVFHWAATQSQTHARARWVRNSPMIVFSAWNNHRFIHSIPWKKKKVARLMQSAVYKRRRQRLHEAHGSGKAVKLQRECG